MSLAPASDFPLIPGTNGVIDFRRVNLGLLTHLGSDEAWDIAMSSLLRLCEHDNLDGHKFTASHALSTAEYVIKALQTPKGQIFLRQTNVSAAEVFRGALHHDDGKICVSLQTLQTKEVLTDTQVRELHAHPEMGYQPGKAFNLPHLVLVIILAHHIIPIPPELINNGYVNINGVNIRSYPPHTFDEGIINVSIKDLNMVIPRDFVLIFTLVELADKFDAMVRPRTYNGHHGDNVEKRVSKARGELGDMVNFVIAHNPYFRLPHTEFGKTPEEVTTDTFSALLDSFIQTALDPDRVVPTMTNIISWSPDKQQGYHNYRNT